MGALHWGIANVSNTHALCLTRHDHRLWRFQLGAHHLPNVFFWFELPPPALSTMLNFLANVCVSHCCLCQPGLTDALVFWWYSTRVLAFGGCLSWNCLIFTTCFPGDNCAYCLTLLSYHIVPSFAEFPMVVDKRGWATQYG